MIFVFGSNLSGRHGKGAALFAKQHHGAVEGQGVGLQGNSYGIPTKDGRFIKWLGHPANVLSLEVIAEHVEDFKTFARDNPQLTFQVTPIGCGLAGYKHEQIAPMFEDAPANCIIPDEFENILIKENK